MNQTDIKGGGIKDLSHSQTMSKCQSTTSPLSTNFLSNKE